MRLGFVTCVELGRACIEALVEMGAPLELLMTLPDDVAVSKSGRVFLDDLSSARGIPLTKVTDVNEPAAIRTIEDADLDWLFIIGWSQVAGPNVLTSPRRGVLGMHPTLLPEGRGRASIPWAILKGLPETGVTLFQLDEGIDTGPILAQERIPVADDETATTLYDKVSAAHVSLIKEVWPRLLDGTIVARAQDEAAATTWPGRRPEDGAFSFAAESTDSVDRIVRALTHPYPGAFTRWRDGVLRVWAGRPVPDGDPSAPMTFRTLDGLYEVTDFSPETEEPS